MNDEIGRKAAERAIQYGDELAAVGVAGLAEPLDLEPWVQRLLAGFAGARPALPNQGRPLRLPRRRWWQFWKPTA